MYRAWESLGQEDLAAAGDDAGFVKDESDAEEREYHRRLQVGREKRASRQQATRPAGEAAAGLLSDEAPAAEEPPPAPKDKPLFFVP